MKLKVFTLCFSNSHDGFDDEPIQQFTADKEVIEHTAYFFTKEKIPYLTILIAYRVCRSAEQTGALGKCYMIYDDYRVNVNKSFNFEFKRREKKSGEALTATPERVA